MICLQQSWYFEFKLKTVIYVFDTVVWWQWDPSLKKSRKSVSWPQLTCYLEKMCISLPQRPEDLTEHQASAVKHFQSRIPYFPMSFMGQHWPLGPYRKFMARRCRASRSGPWWCRSCFRSSWLVLGRFWQGCCWMKCRWVGKWWWGGFWISWL